MSKLEKYFSKEDIQSLEIMKKSISESMITITCVGLYNHGKSTLLNVLIKDFEYKTFKTADARETTLNKEVIYNDIKYIDTPGLNAQEKDDKKVMEVIQKSDITLFVHTVTTGELNKAEVDFLVKIQKHWKNPQEFINRTIFVLSRIDGIGNYEDIENTKNKMQSQIKDIFDIVPMIVPVSSEDYKEGMLHNEKELIDESNIKILEEKIDFFKNKFQEAIIKTKRERLNNKYNELISKLTRKLKDKEEEIKSLRAKQINIVEEFDNDVTKIENTLKNMYDRLY